MARQEYLPFGLGGQLEQEKETLWARRVASEVYWANPEIQSPFELEEGKSSNLALLLDPWQRKGDLSLEVWGQHWRSALLGRVLAKDSQGRIYRDFDLKGTGLLYQDRGLKVGFSQDGHNYGRETGPQGMADLPYLLTERNMTEILTKMGIRTYRILALIRIFELFSFGGELISEEEAKRRGQINRDRKLAIALRVFTTKARMEDILSRPLSRPTLIQDAQKLVASEFHDNSLLTKREYFRWFAKTLGEQLALMHKAGYYHGGISTHNISLDCCFTDADSMGAISYGRQIEHDCNNAFLALRSFSASYEVPWEQTVLGEIFDESYKDTTQRF